MLTASSAGTSSASLDPQDRSQLRRGKNVVPDARRPCPTIGLAALMRLAYAGESLQPVWDQLAARVTADPADAAAMMDMSVVLQLAGERQRGLDMQAAALELERVYHRPHGRADGLRVAALVVAGDFMANTPLDFLLEGSDIDLHLVYVDSAGNPPAEIPEHDVAFMAVSESPTADAALQGVAEALQAWPAPVMNGHPARVAALTRDGIAALFALDAHVLAPPVIQLPRQSLAVLGDGGAEAATTVAGGGFPFVVRPVGSHAGQGLCKLDDPAAAAAYLAEQEGTEFYLSPFVDYRSADGLYRKQRIVFINKRPFISHMAISEHWMVHYLSAGMTTNAGKRAEEAAFMRGFDTGFAARHAAAFRSLCDKIGLDCFGIDCAETRDGRLLLFEADVAMIVHALDPEPDFSYKKPVMQRLFAAFQRELEANARSPQRSCTGGSAGAALSSTA